MSYRGYSSRRGHGDIHLEPAEYLIVWLSAIPILGALINMTLLIQRKRYVWLFFPVIFLVGFYIYWQQPSINYERDIVTDEIEADIEDALVNIRIPKNYSLEEEDIIPLVEDALAPLIDVDFIKQGGLAALYYKNIAKSYYKAMEKGITNKIYTPSADNTYSISLYDLHYIYDIHSFSWRYAEELVPFNWLYFVSLVIVVSGWLMFFLINYGIYMNMILKKEEDTDYLPPFESETPVAEVPEPSQPVVSTTPPVQPEPAQQPQIIEEIIAPKEKVCINTATAEVIKEKLSLTALQAKFIVEERNQGGPFLTMDNFTDRTGLSARICNRIADQLDFSDTKNSPTGRVIDF